MKDFEKVRDIKRAAQGGLLAIPGVHAVGVGAKIVGGQRTQEISIMVYLVKKKPLSELRPEEVIPPEIDGVKTDVIESEVLRLHAEDASRYRPLKGGCQIRPSGQTPNIVTGNPATTVLGGGLGTLGTLGCFARTGGASPKIVAITCWHVVGLTPFGQKLSLDPPQVVLPNITFSGTNTPGSMVAVRFKAGGSSGHVFYRTADSDTLGGIAAAVASKINSVAPPGVNASASGSQVQISGLNAPSDSLTGDIFSAHAKNTWADFVTSVYGSAQGNVISSIGRAQRACAAYINVNTGGVNPTSGVFVPIAAGDNSKVIIDSISKAINTAKIPSNIPNIPVITTVSGLNVTFTGTQEIECEVSSDLRVGQPTDTMCSVPCVSDRIGVILDAHVDVDVALIELDPGMKYRADILDIGLNGAPGAVKGIHDIHLENSGYKLKKRGFETRLTNGTLKSLDLFGYAIDHDQHNDPPEWKTFIRFFQGAFSIAGAFSDKGDSGAAVLNESNEVVGILFGGGKTVSAATPIKTIFKSFKDLNLTIETAAKEGIDKVVPSPAKAAAPHAFSAVEPLRAASPVPLFENLQRVQREIVSTPQGQRYSELAERHFGEVQTLVNTNRRVAAVWHRNGGPQILQALLRIAQIPGQRIPSEIDGKPLAACLKKIQSVLTRYGSEALSTDLSEFGPALARLAGLTYSEALGALADSRTS